MKRPVRLCAMLVLSLIASICLYAGGDIPLSSHRDVSLLCADNIEVPVARESIELSQTLQALAGFPSIDQCSAVFRVENINDSVARACIAILECIRLQNSEVVLDLDTIYKQALHDQSLVIVRILERLTFDELLQLVKLSSLLQLNSSVNTLFVEFFVRALVTQEMLKKCIRNPMFLHELLQQIPIDQQDLVLSSFLNKRGYLLWGCLFHLHNSNLQYCDKYQAVRNKNLEKPYRGYPVIKNKRGEGLLGVIVESYAPDIASKHSVSNSGQYLNEPIDSHICGQNYGFISVRRWYGGYSDKMCVEIYDIETKKRVAHFLETDVCSHSSPPSQYIKVSDNNLTISVITNSPSQAIQNLLHKKFPEAIYKTAVQTLDLTYAVEALSYEQKFFLILCEYAYLLNMPIIFNKDSYFRHLFEQLDSVLREEFLLRYKFILNKIELPKCILL